MKPKTIKITYWCLIVLFSLAMLGDAVGGITKQQAGIDVLNHLGYPIYIMPFLGYLKVLGVIALLQTKFRNLKEWAFAGFAFNFIGAAVSRAAMGDGAGMVAMPLVMLAVLFVTYWFWRKYDVLNNI
ncbi:DoxX family protein [Mucilaginibacter flavidus]|uniref:DoxX family protein n=1 Tax=Mucilaginibacter flavidus TaxID=2949309 RepID=UPI0020928817|nr:DoxX family protein [Mucilaginibacter flavidus]MCO5950271.1 DoxX family protein [Mucilaginibacter flavidus]